LNKTKNQIYLIDLAFQMQINIPSNCNNV